MKKMIIINNDKEVILSIARVTSYRCTYATHTHIAWSCCDRHQMMPSAIQTRDRL